MLDKYLLNKRTSECSIKKPENKSGEYRNDVVFGEHKNKDQSTRMKTELVKGLDLVLPGNVKKKIHLNPFWCLRAASVIKIVTENQRERVIIFFLPKY